MKEKKFTFGKIQVIIITLIFISVLIASFTTNFEGVSDTAFAGVAISVSGTIYAAVLVNYYKKSRAENLVKLRILTIKEIAKTQIETYESVAKIKKTYELDDDDITSIKENVSVDEFMQESIDSVNSKLNEFDEEASSVTEATDIQSVG